MGFIVDKKVATTAKEYSYTCKININYEPSEMLYYEPLQNKEIPDFRSEAVRYKRVQELYAFINEYSSSSNEIKRKHYSNIKRDPNIFWKSNSSGLTSSVWNFWL